MSGRHSAISEARRQFTSPKLKFIRLISEVKRSKENYLRKFNFATFRLQLLRDLLARLFLPKKTSLPDRFDELVKILY